MELATAFWACIKDFANSNFSTAIFGAFFGAVFGALAAQRIAERSKDRDDLLKQLQNTNGAIVVSLGICNAMIALKKQYVRELYATFQSHRAELLAFEQKRKLGQLDHTPEFHLLADFKTLQMPTVPLAVLQALIYEKLSITGRPLIAVAQLFGALASLADMIAARNHVIERFKVRDPNDRLLIPHYFGFPYGGGHVSSEYKDTVEAIHNLTDDTIFFSDLIRKDLAVIGDATVKKLSARHGISTLKVQKTDLAKAQAEGLLPDEKNYADWLEIPGPDTYAPPHPARARLVAWVDRIVALASSMRRGRGGRSG